MGKWVHRVQNEQLDVEGGRAVCAHCGPVALHVSPGGTYRCVNAYMENLEGQSKRVRNDYHGVDIRVARVLKKLAGACELCGTDENLQLDHCHQTRELRGIVCGSCNKWIASFERAGAERAFNVLRYLRWEDTQ